jgi:hypothetical protein
MGVILHIGLRGANSPSPIIFDRPVRAGGGCQTGQGSADYGNPTAVRPLRLEVRTFGLSGALKQRAKPGEEQGANRKHD